MQQSAFMFIFVMSELKKFHSYMLVINNTTACCFYVIYVDLIGGINEISSPECY